MMTNKKLYAAIVENAERINNDQVNQINEELTQSNDFLLRAFAESYNNALESFTAQTIELQKQQNEAMISSYRSVLEDLKNEQLNNSKHIEQLVIEVKNICIEQNRSINITLESLSESIKTSVSEMKNMIEQETNNHAILTKEIHDYLTNINQEVTKQSEIINSSSEFSKKTCEFIARKVNDLSAESVSKIDKIREILSEFSDRQDNTNLKYSKEMKRSIEDGFEASTEKISTDIKPILEEHYKEISETDKKIEKISSNYENQFNLIVDSLQKAQNLSSKDVQILEKLVEAGKNEL